MKLSKEGLTKAEYRYYKQYGVLPEPEPVAVRSEVTVLCVRFGNKYGREYVERLRNMTARHMVGNYEFACLTDDPRPIDGVRIIHQKSAGYIKPWWHKVHMFDPNLDISGRILYVDLDVIIANNLNRLVQGLTDEFMGIQDFNRKFHANWRMLNSSVMSWVHGSQTSIWDQFVANPQGAQRMHGDQDWIWHCARDRIKFWPVPWIQSYKWEIRNREELIMRTGKGGFKTVSNLPGPPDCSIAVFHGDPKPEEVQDSFVVDNWQ